MANTARGEKAFSSGYIWSQLPKYLGLEKNSKLIKSSRSWDIGRTEKLKPRFWCNPTQKPRVKNIFRAPFETYPKTHFVASWSFWYRCQNDLQKYFFYPWFLGWVAPDSGFGFFCARHLSAQAPLRTTAPQRALGRYHLVTPHAYNAREARWDESMPTAYPPGAHSFPRSELGSYKRQ